MIVCMCSVARYVSSLEYILVHHTHTYKNFVLSMHTTQQKSTRKWFIFLLVQSSIVARLTQPFFFG